MSSSTSTASVSPDGRAKKAGGENSRELLASKISGVLEIDDPSEKGSIKNEINSLLAGLGVKKSSHFRLMYEAAIKEKFDELKSDLPVTSQTLYKSQILAVTTFLRKNEITDEITIDDIMDANNTMDSKPAAVLRSPPRRGRELGDVPNLNKFTGEPYDWSDFKPHVETEFGKAKYLGYIKNEETCEKDPSNSQACFFALRAAIKDGSAAHIAEEMDNSDDHNAARLWSKIIASYDTPLNKANDIMHSLRKLLKLKLDTNTSARKFASDIRKAVLKLNSKGSPIGKDKDAMRAIIIEAIVDRDYENATNELIRSPTSTLEEMLNTLIDQQSTMETMDGNENRTSGDGSRVRRTSRPTKLNNKDRPKGTKQSVTFGTPKHMIPTFPHTWKLAIPSKLWDIMCKWKNDINNGVDPAVAKEKYSLIEEEVAPKRKKNKRKTTGKRARARSVSTQSSRSRNRSGGSSSSSDDDPLPKSRIKSRSGVVIVTEEDPVKVNRRVSMRAPDIHEASSDQHVMIMDGAADQTLCTHVWSMKKFSGRYVTMCGAFAGRNVGEKFPVGTLVAKATFRDGSEYCVIAHEALYDENEAQTEGLLSLHQCRRMRGNAVDDVATCETGIDGKPGTQSARFGDERVGLFFDGAKCFFAIEPITDDEYKNLPRLTITPGSEPYVPNFRVHTTVRAAPTVSHEWRETLGFIPRNVVDKTLAATTQFVPTVEAETREIMRDHIKSRFPELRVKRVNDRCYTDTFFSSIPSIRGYKCWQLFSYQKTGMDVVFLMRIYNRCAASLPDLFRKLGVRSR